MNQLSIPYHRASIGEDEIRAVSDVLKSGWLTTGPKTHQFEAEFARYVGVEHAVAVNSGTAALQLALDAIGIGPGDEVLVPTYTFTATAEVVTYFGARPVLCDSLPGAFNMDAAALEQHISPRTRAVIPVHFGGEPCDLGTIHAVADRHHLHVIEDAAHALPASYDGRRIGGISDLTAFSFYANKTMTTGEGGMLTTQNGDYARRARQMRLHGISGDAWKRYSPQGSWFYEVEAAGYKLNLTDIAAALGIVQLRRSDEFCRGRCRIAEIYRQRLAAIEELEMPPAGATNSHAWHLFVLRIRPETLTISRNAFIEELKKSGIGTSVHFIPLHLHPFYANTYGYRKGDFPNAEDAYSRAVSLPIYPDLCDEELEYVIATVKRIVQASRKKVFAMA